MSKVSLKLLPAALALAAALLSGGCSDEPRSAYAQTIKEQLKRGEYLVTAGGCHDCHSPKVLAASGPVIDSSRVLSGHPVGSPLPEIPSGAIGLNGWGALTSHDFTAWAGPWGISFASNLTPDEVTGTGAWLESSFIDAMRNGRHLGTGRAILPPMPWQNIGQLNDDDLKAIFAYLRSLRAVNNMVPLPIPPEKLARMSM